MSQIFRNSDIDNEGFYFVRVLRRRAKWLIILAICLFFVWGWLLVVEGNVEYKQDWEPESYKELVHEQEVEIELNEPLYIGGKYEPDTLNLNALIPTWPDYIELEKNLVIDANEFVFAHASYDGYHIEQGVSNTIVIPKGTKIYFTDVESNQ